MQKSSCKLPKSVTKNLDLKKMQHFKTDFSTAGSEHKARHQDALGFYTYSL